MANLSRSQALRRRRKHHQGDSELCFSAVFSRVVAVVGGTALQLRRLTQGSHEPAWGSAPVIPAARPQGAIPTLKMPTARGWSEGHTPVAAPGLKVNAFAKGLKHPRWINVLPNGDVLIAEFHQRAQNRHAEHFRLRHGQHDAARRRGGRQREPDHIVA